MLIKTLLNQVCKFKSFVYIKVVYSEQPKKLDVYLEARRNSKPICSSCGIKGSCYDHQPERSYEFVPLWGIRVFFIYCPRRVDCVACGPRIEKLPWVEGKCEHTIFYKLFLAHWAKKSSWQEVAREFNTSWSHVFSAVKYVVNWGLEHRDLSGITAIGVDEIQWHIGHNYLTLVYQIDQHCRRLLYATENRSARSLLKFFHMLGKERYQSIQYVCSDMWQPYLKVIKKKLPDAIHILDRFHIVANINKALDKVRAEEARKLVKENYEPVLTNTRWCFLKCPENLTQNQQYTLKEVLQYNLKTIRAYLLKEDFQQLWKYDSPYWAGKFLNAWCTRAMRSKIEPIKTQARSIRKHQELILNWFRAKKQFSSGIVEGFNCKAKLTIRKAYGFRTFNAIEIALFHQLGALPEPKFTHSFF